jgi:hypothetical protein
MLLRLNQLRLRSASGEELLLMAVLGDRRLRAAIDRELNRRCIWQIIRRAVRADRPAAA